MVLEISVLVPLINISIFLIFEIVFVTFKTVLITKGATWSMYFNKIFFSIFLLSKNVLEFFKENLFIFLKLYKKLIKPIFLEFENDFIKYLFCLFIK